MEQVSRNDCDIVIVRSSTRKTDSMNGSQLHLKDSA
jgi:hypothetical protein